MSVGRVPQLSDLRDELWRTAVRMSQDQLVVGSAGNISVRCTKADRILVTPAGVTYDVLTASDLVSIDLRTRQPSHGLSPTSEAPLHLGIMQAMPEVRAIVHTHSRYAAACAVARVDIPFICNESLGPRAERILVSKFATPGNVAIADAALETFDRQPGSRAILLANHGVVALGETLGDAYLVAQQVEWVAQVYVLARTIGVAKVLTRSQRVAIAGTYGVTIATEKPNARARRPTAETGVR